MQRKWYDDSVAVSIYFCLFILVDKEIRDNTGSVGNTCTIVRILEIFELLFLIQRLNLITTYPWISNSWQKKQFLTRYLFDKNCQYEQQNEIIFNY